ncbi:hypothetical protein [Streptomyces sp. NPDC059874]|uniref:hypothetical protein n=1 Tax=Streptomyces sp. NPDC059874 TaxID=3346983 RepID=UPI00364743C0
MVIALLVFMFLGLVAAVTPGAVVGYATVALSRKLSLAARVPLLVVLAMATAAVWLSVGEAANVLMVIVMGLSFSATLASGAAFLGLEARKRRTPRYPAPAWQGW